MVQGIHNKQKKNGFGRNSAFSGSQAYCYNCRTKETEGVDQVVECKRQSCHMGWPQAHGTQKMKFPYKGSLRRLTNTSQPS